MAKQREKMHRAEKDLLKHANNDLEVQQKGAKTQGTAESS